MVLIDAGYGVIQNGVFTLRFFEMTTENTGKYKTPFKFVILELLGAALLGIGLNDKLSDGFKFIPEAIQFQNYQLVLIILGVLSVIPNLIHIFKSFNSKSKT